MKHHQTNASSLPAVRGPSIISPSKHHTFRQARHPVDSSSAFSRHSLVYQGSKTLLSTTVSHTDAHFPASQIFRGSSAFFSAQSGLSGLESCSICYRFTYFPAPQISEVVDNMKDLISFNEESGLGPVASLRAFPTRNERARPQGLQGPRPASNEGGEHPPPFREEPRPTPSHSFQQANVRIFQAATAFWILSNFCSFSAIPTPAPEYLLLFCGFCSFPVIAALSL
jgi:hypothetical protein